MNTDIEGLLREGMERFTADLRAPAGMTRRAVRRRRRRLAARTAAGAAALAAGAVALAAAGVPGGLGNGIGGSTRPAAYVVKRTDSALSAAEPGDIAQMTVTTRRPIPGGKTMTTTAVDWFHGGQWRSVTDKPTGHPVYDEGFSASSGYTLVSYLRRTWARQRGLGRPVAVSKATPVSGPRRCEPVAAAHLVLFQPGLPGFGFTASPLPAAKVLRTEISCGALAVAGRQRVDGIEAIKLTSRPDSLISETIWVNPGTYLPVRVIVRSAPGTPGFSDDGQPALQQTANIIWLPPTSQNLAKLTVPIPAGFRQVPFTEVVGPIAQQIPGGPLAKSKAPPCPTLAGPVCKDGSGPSGPGSEHAGYPRLRVPYGQAP